MKYISTRSDFSTTSSAEALLRSIGPDGGMLVPACLPFYDQNSLETLGRLSFRDRMAKILKDFLPDFSEKDLKKAVQRAFDSLSFKKDIVKVKSLNPYAQHEFILELWNGPTGSFKDISLQLFPQLLSLACTSTGRADKMCILSATSGDTGSAALAGFKKLPQHESIVLYPHRSLTTIQKLQLHSFAGKQCHIIPVVGNFDQVQAIAKNILLDPVAIQKAAKRNQLILTANSMSFGRLLPQIVIYISAYVDMLVEGYIKPEEKLNVVVPSGNFSNLLAAWYARQMGVQFSKLVCASNRNKILSDFFSNGKYDANRKLVRTNSPSMDILLPYNIERLLFELSGHNYQRVVDWMSDLKNQGSYQVENDIIRRIQAVFVGGFADDKATLRTIREVYDDTDYAVDTATAVGFNIYNRYSSRANDQSKVLYVATTSPYKVPRAMLEALNGEKFEDEEELNLLGELYREIEMPIADTILNLNPQLREAITHLESQSWYKMNPTVDKNKEFMPTGVLPLDEQELLKGEEPRTKSKEGILMPDGSLAGEINFCADAKINRDYYLENSPLLKIADAKTDFKAEFKTKAYLPNEIVDVIYHLLEYGVLPQPAAKQSKQKLEQESQDAYPRLSEDEAVNKKSEAGNNHQDANTNHRAIDNPASSMPQEPVSADISSMPQEPVSADISSMPQEPVSADITSMPQEPSI